MTHFDIVNGPSKFDLMVSLFDNNAKPRRTVRFVLDHGHELDVAITMVQQDTGKKPISWRQYQAELAKNPKFEAPGYVEH